MATAANSSALKAIAETTALTLIARAAIAMLALVVPWAAAEITALRRDMITLGERQIAISERVGTAIAEDRRRIEALETADFRIVEANAARMREIADMTGALRELNAVLRGLDQRMDMLRMERRGALMQEIPG